VTLWCSEQGSDPGAVSKRTGVAHRGDPGAVSKAWTSVPVWALRSMQTRECHATLSLCRPCAACNRQKRECHASLSLCRPCAACNGQNGESATYPCPYAGPAQHATGRMERVPRSALDTNTCAVLQTCRQLLLHTHSKLWTCRRCAVIESWEQQLVGRCCAQSHLSVCVFVHMMCTACSRHIRW